MGLKGAPSYFQRVMATVVLGGLIMSICELYIDDLLIYADSEEQLLERLELVLNRFREFNKYYN